MSMPLVTRNSARSSVFRQATEPVDWIDGDLWVDTSQNPPLVKVNDNGTATSLIGANSLITISGNSLELYKWLFGV